MFISFVHCTALGGGGEGGQCGKKNLLHCAPSLSLRALEAHVHKTTLFVAYRLHYLFNLYDRSLEDYMDLKSYEK
jgi:hypothetical protein